MKVRIWRELRLGVTASLVALAAWGAAGASDEAPFYEIRGVLISGYAGQPIPHVGVRLIWRNPAPPPTPRERAVQTDYAQTDAAGAFAIPTLKRPDQPFAIHVTGGKRTASVITPVYPASPAEPLEIRVPTDGEWIAGRVVTTDGKPARGGIGARQVDSPPLVSERAVVNVAADEEGVFVLGPLAPGRYDVEFTQLGILPPGRQRVRLVKPDVATAPLDQIEQHRLTFVTEPEPPSASLDVWVVDQTGAPVSEFRLGATADGTYPYHVQKSYTSTAVEPGLGRFRLPIAGRYLMTVRSRDGYGFWTGHIAPGADGSFPPQMIVLNRGTGRITGRILNADGTPHQGGLDLRVFSPRLPASPGMPPASTFLFLSASIDAQGRFASQLLPPGTYHLYVAGSVEPIAYKDLGMQVEHLEGRNTVLNLVREPESMTTYEGMVMDPRGQPLAGATLTFYANSSTHLGSGPVTTDARGRWQIPLPPRARLGCRVDHPMYGAMCVPIADSTPSRFRILTLQDSPIDLRIRALIQSDDTRKALALRPWEPEITPGMQQDITMFLDVMPVSVAQPEGPQAPTVLEWIVPRVSRGQGYRIGSPSTAAWRMTDRGLKPGEDLARRITISTPITIPTDPSLDEFVLELSLDYTGQPVSATRQVRFRVVEAGFGAPVAQARIHVLGGVGRRDFTTQSDGTCAAILETQPLRITVLRRELVEASHGTLARTRQIDPISPMSLELNVAQLADGETIELKVDPIR